MLRTGETICELGNLQSEGHGISNFQTMLSIGLGQEQQFTLILQTLQQLRDVYGESVDKIVQGNTSNIIFLKSTDDSMLDTLQKMSGIRHVTMKDSKTITKDLEKPIMAVEGKVSYSFNAKEVPVISYNDMAFLTMRNAIVFRAGDPPIWNRNETILLMSWKLFSNTITQPGKEYSLQTIPTLSTALEFDVRKNQPDFIKMWEKRRDQALVSEEAKDIYQQAYGYSDNDVSQLDPNVWADDVMRLIDDIIAREDEEEALNQEDMPEDLMMEFAEAGDPEYEDNEEQARANVEAQQKRNEWSQRRFANGQLSPESFTDRGLKRPNHSLDEVILEAFRECKAAMYDDTVHFRKTGVGISSVDGVPYIVARNESKDLQTMKDATESEGNRMYAEPGAVEEQPDTSLSVTDQFLYFIASQENWADIAGGKFEAEMARAYERSMLGEG